MQSYSVYLGLIDHLLLIYSLSCNHLSVISLYVVVKGLFSLWEFWEFLFEGYMNSLNTVCQLDFQMLNTISKLKFGEFRKQKWLFIFGFMRFHFPNSQILYTQLLPMLLKIPWNFIPKFIQANRCKVSNLTQTHLFKHDSCDLSHMHHTSSKSKVKLFYAPITRTSSFNCKSKCL